MTGLLPADKRSGRPVMGGREETVEPPTRDGARVQGPCLYVSSGSWLPHLIA